MSKVTINIPAFFDKMEVRLESLSLTNIETKGVLGRMKYIYFFNFFMFN